jgi:predicted nucleotidyltransferase
VLGLGGPRREDIVAAIRGALESLDYVLGAWEQGAASFGRVDEYSDIDLCLIVEDCRVEDVLKAVEGALDARFGVERTFRLPEPTWHGHSQCFYWLRGAGPYLFVDMAVEKASSKNRFLEYSVHGPPRVLVNRRGTIKDDTPSKEEFADSLVRRIETLKAIFGLFQAEVEKELARGHELEALAFYNSMTLRPLVEALRIRHCPWRHDFHTRYVYHDLPPPVVRRLHRFFFVKDAKDIAKKRAEAEKWFLETVRGLDREAILRSLG